MNRWSLKQKIYLIISLLIVAAVVISALGLKKMNEIKVSLDSIVSGPAARIGHAHELKELFLIQVINEKNLILEDSGDQLKVMLKRLSDRDAEIKGFLAKAKEISTEKGKSDLEDFSRLYGEWWTVNKNIQQLIDEDKNQEAFVLSKTKGRELRLKVEDKMDEIIKRNEGFMLSETHEADADYSVARNLVLLISSISVVLSLVLASVILNQICSAIGEVVQTLESGSSDVTSASQMIASSSEELSEAATEQASSLEETASSIAEMNSMVQKNSESAKRTSTLAQRASSSAEKGKMVVKDMISAIEQISQSNDTIKNQIEDSNQKIAEIVKVIEEIGSKTKVINDIVFQTKLLSFNASVEAARAGEHGKGFAVVAEEVGSLAQMSGNAAKEISDMLEGSIQKVEAIVTDTRTKVSHLVLEGKQKVDSGTKVAQECGHVLNEIVDSISSVTEMASEISTACHEQALGVQEISKVMGQLDQVTQTNAAASEEVASSAEQLSGQSESLHAAVGILVTVISGNKGGQEQFDRKIVASVPKKKALAKKSGGKVIPLRKKTFDAGKSLKLNSVPSEDDPRFEEA